MENGARERDQAEEKRKNAYLCLHRAMYINWCIFLDETKGLRKIDNRQWYVRDTSKTSWDRETRRNISRAEISLAIHWCLSNSSVNDYRAWKNDDIDQRRNLLLDMRIYRLKRSHSEDINQKNQGFSQSLLRALSSIPMLKQCKIFIELRCLFGLASVAVTNDTLPWSNAARLDRKPSQSNDHNAWIVFGFQSNEKKFSSVLMNYDRWKRGDIRFTYREHLIRYWWIIRNFQRQFSSISMRIEKIRSKTLI